MVFPKNFRPGRAIGMNAGGKTGDATKEGHRFTRIKNGEANHLPVKLNRGTPTLVGSFPAGGPSLCRLKSAFPAHGLDAHPFSEVEALHEPPPKHGRDTFHRVPIFSA
jgi:hypothetical protein